jgi:hypothetical protein
MFQKGQRCGHGRLDFIEDKIGGNGKTMGYYEGEWKAGNYHGNGCIVWGSTGCSYEGEWLNGSMHGHGVMKDDRTGTILQEGQWVLGKFQEVAAVNAAIIQKSCDEDTDDAGQKDDTTCLTGGRRDDEGEGDSTAAVDVALVAKATSELDLQTAPVAHVLGEEDGRTSKAYQCRPRTSSNGNDDNKTPHGNNNVSLEAVELD